MLRWVGTAAMMIGPLARGAEVERSGGPTTSKSDSSAIRRLIDEQIDATLVAGRETSAPIADDSEFLRRVSLDLVGVIPTAERAAAFLADQEPSKRARLIDELLASPRYGLHQADRWEGLLMIRDSTNRRLKSQPLYDWLAERFNKNVGWNQIVIDLLTANGSQEENGAATFFIALRTPDKLTDQVARLFMGVQLQCAQCHDHPFDRWKRADYWSMATFFSKVRAGGKKVGIAKNGPERVNESGKGKKVPPVESALELPAKFLGGERPTLESNAPYRPVLANWLASPENPYFAKAIVNRTWSHFFGRGLVNPVDNISDGVAVSHPELFERLAKQFVADDYDLKGLIRGVCNSQAYQRESSPPGESAADPTSYSRMTIRPMSPEQLFDSLALVLGTMQEDREPLRKGGGKKGSPTATRPRFVAFFDVPDGAEPTDYTVGIPQVLQLMNSPQMNRDAALIRELVKGELAPRQSIEQLYLATLTRRPSHAEEQRLLEFLKKDGQAPRDALSDVLWVLLNSSEFTLNH